MDKKTYLAKVDRSTQKPKGKHLLRPCQRLWGPIAGILDIAGSKRVPPALLVWYFRELCPLHHKYALKGRDKKKLVEFSTKVGGWGQQWTDFLLFFFFLKKNLSLKHWIVSKDHFKTHFFFFNFWVGDPSQLKRPSDKCQMAHIIQNPFHGM